MLSRIYSKSNGNWKNSLLNNSWVNEGGKVETTQKPYILQHAIKVEREIF